MTKFKRLYNRVTTAWRALAGRYDPAECEPARNYVEPSDHRRVDLSMDFTVTFADGGTIISVTRYDDHADCNLGGVYVRHDDDDLSSAIAQILTIERLRKN